MPDRKPTHAWAVVALIALLLITTFGSIWHHHDNAASADNCPICHVNHQPVEPSLATDRSFALIPLGSQPDPQDYGLLTSPLARRVPARAPPSA